MFLKIAGEDVAAEDANLVTLQENIEKSVNEVVRDGMNHERSERSRIPFSNQFVAFFKKSVSSQVCYLQLFGLMSIVLMIFMLAYSRWRSGVRYSCNSSYPSS